MYYEKDNPENTIMQADIPTENQNKYEFDYDQSQTYWQDFLSYLKEEIRKRHPEFEECDEHFNEKHFVLESPLFGIATEDNEWSAAIELLSKTNVNRQSQIEPFKQLYEELKDILLDWVPEIYIRTGPWTSYTVKRQVQED